MSFSLANSDDSTSNNNFLQTFKLIQEQLDNDDNYNETMEVYLKIKKHPKLNKFKLISVKSDQKVPDMNDASIFIFGIDNSVHEPCVSLHLIFNDIVFSENTFYMVQIFYDSDRIKFSSVLYDNLTDALERCISELEKKKNEN